VSLLGVGKALLTPNWDIALINERCEAYCLVVVKLRSIKLIVVKLVVVK